MKANILEQEYIEKWADKARPYYKQNNWTLGGTIPSEQFLIEFITTVLLNSLKDNNPNKWACSGRILIKGSAEDKVRFNLFLEID